MSELLAPTRIVVSYDDRTPRDWRLEADYRCTTNELGDLTVPAGFEWDGISFPNPVRRLVRAGIVHDYLYTTKACRRHLADQVFYELLRRDGLRPILAWLMWCSVRLWGGSHWEEA